MPSQSRDSRHSRATRPIHPTPPTASSIGSQLALVWLGGGLGAVLRYLLQQTTGAFSIDSFAAQTWVLLAVNVLGCLMIGYLTYRHIKKDQQPRIYAFTITGVLGGFTSFSAYISALHVWNTRAELGMAVTYALVTSVLCMVACWSGQRAAQGFGAQGFGARGLGAQGLGAQANEDAHQ